MDRMTNQQMADRALEADRARRAAMARGDYQKSREHLAARNGWIMLMDGNYQNPKLAPIWRRR